MTAISTKILVAALALSGIASAQSKQVLTQQMNGLDRRAQTATSAGNVALASQLKAQVRAISALLGGDLPSASNGMQAANASSTSAPQFIVAPANCYGSPGTTFGPFTGTTGAIPDVAVSTFTATVAGVVGPIWDVDLTLAITHTYAADLDITLTSPNGLVCDVTSDNGGANDDVFNGTLFDDESLNPVVTYVYTNGVAAPDLKPEQSINGVFRGLAGANANGVWTLSITDDAGADIGNLNSWSLKVTDGTINPPPAPPTGFNPTLTFSKLTNVSILDNTVVSDTQTVSGCIGNLYDVDVYTEITHTWNGDLVLSVTTPAGTSVLLSNRWGGANDDVFNGTWFDQSSLNPIATYVFTNGVVAPDLQPDGNLTDFWQCPQDPNGVWTLTIADQAGGDVGNLNRWDLKITTGQGGGCGSSVVTYCTSSTSTSGCNATMGASAVAASIGAGPGSFVLSASNVEGQKLGLIFYGITGRTALLWATGSTSYLCVKSPTQRGLSGNSGGSIGGCNGSISLDFFAFMSANPGALGQPLTAGQVYDAQGWFRDPAAAKTTNLTNGIEFTLCP
ncbi:MAG: proprotein convertase P-domain-containing protein [Planctomycetes bacterium]|nr:proprotein convertase P-domain-containing protein [Planctomycetota bacterium]